MRICCSPAPLNRKIFASLQVAGASMIIAVDINEDKFEFARKWGATHCINPTKCEGGVVGEIIKMTTTDAPNDPGGVDFVSGCVCTLIQALIACAIMVLCPEAVKRWVSAAV